MQLSFRLDKRPGKSHVALDGKKELSHFYDTQAKGDVSAYVTPWHKTDAESHLHKSDQKHMSSQKSLHQDMVCLFK